MLAVRFDGTLALATVPEPTARAGEAICRVRMAGICGTDVAIVRGYAAFAGVLGHEFVGEVESCADAGWLGRRVVAEINAPCGTCPNCTGGRPRHCDARTVLGIRDRDGCFAERVRVPIANLHHVPPGIPDAAAVFTEPLAAALGVLARVPIPPGDPAVVIGDGKLGLLVAMALVRHGCAVTVIGHHDRKLAIAEAFGARVAAPDAAPRRSAPWIVEATGAPGGLALALALVRPRGTIVLKSTWPGTAPIALASVVVDEVNVVGSRCGDFAPALRALADGSIDPTPLVDHALPLTRALEAFALARTPGVLKVLLDASR